MDVGIARDALFIAKRLGDSLAERDPGVLCRMMLVHMQVAGHLHGEVEETVSGEQFEHMVEEADPRGDLGLAGAVEGDRHGDIGLGGATADARGAHHQNPLRNK